MAPTLSELCMNGDVAGLRSAIEWGADVNSRRLGGKTPLMLALWNHQNAMVEMLTEMDEVDVNCEDNDGAYFSPFQGVYYLYRGLSRAPKPYFGLFFLEF